MATEATLAHVFVSKYADHLPLYRQVQVYGRQGINLDRSTLVAWIGKSAFALTPFYDALTAIAAEHKQTDINDLSPWNYTKPV